MPSVLFKALGVNTYSIYLICLLKHKWTTWLGIYLDSILYLECILSVIQTIDPDVIVQSCAGNGPKNSQLEPLGSCFANWLADQAVRPQCLCQNVACLWVHLHIAGGGEVFLSHYNHILQEPDTKKKEKMFFIHSTILCLWRVTVNAMLDVL